MIDPEAITMLVFFAVAGTVGIACYGFMRSYLIASAIGATATTTLMTIYVVALHPGSPPPKLPWIPVLIIAIGIGSVLTTLPVGIPFFIVRRLTVRKADPAATSHIEAPSRSMWALIATICTLVTLLTVSAARSMTEGARDGALFEASHYGTVDDARRALDMGAHVNAREDYGQTPLMLASYYGHKDTVV